MQAIEIAHALRARRLSLGLTQAQLALFATRSCQEIARIEEGQLAAYSYGGLEHVLSVVGLQFRLEPPPNWENALAMAARSASTSYKLALTPRILQAMLASGVMRDEFRPHLLTLLDEVPVPLVLCAVQEAAGRSQVPLVSMLGHLGQWAASLRATRKGWQAPP